MKKGFLFKLLYFSGLAFVFRECFQKKKVTIVLFHDISRDNAKKAFQYLDKKYNIIDLDTYINAVKKRNNSEIPHKALILTFDDGHIRNFKLLGLIKEHTIPITIFLCAGIINTNRHFWFKYESENVNVHDLRQRSNTERLDILSNEGFRQEVAYDHPQALQSQQIEEMSQYVNFQSHTLFHPILPKCDDNVARHEIFESKEILERDYQLSITTISYPNGDYSERDIHLSKEAGYTCGITVDYGFNDLKTDLFRLKRLSVNDSGNLSEVAVKASGAWAFFKTRAGRKQNYGFSKVT